MHFTTDNNKDGIPDSKGYEPLPLVSFGSMDDELNNVNSNISTRNIIISR